MYKKIKFPDTGIEEMKITDILVKEGDDILQEQSIITVESDKTSIEIPSTKKGKIQKIFVSIGNKIRTGDLILEILDNEKNSLIINSQKTLEKNKTELENTNVSNKKNQKVKNYDILNVKNNIIKNNNNLKKNKILNIEKKKYIHSSPLIRKMARKLNINLESIRGSGLKNRILKEDILKYIEKNKKLENNNFEKIELKYTKFGPCEEIKLNNIQKTTSKNLSSNWKNIPHVTQHIETDITELEKFRIKKNNEFYKNQKNIKLTLLSFMIKICAHALKKYPNFNSSLSYLNQNLIIKKYFNIGIAINTKQGLLVPVIFDVLNKNINDLSKILLNLANKAKNNKLHPLDMQGSCFTISNLGQFKGSFFTPIINAPEIAILGISQAMIKPIWDESKNKFVPKLMLPLSLSYDHRVINGVEGINFLNYICMLISDIRNILI
ncbi:2-oxo acid dehydrogenase subunit E2 [Enterobacteriaceae endosymbiont of Donacia bicoloricornis]|uniref:2-oxo acid dehydrogenase subunit E2 n=1 Tax=Enterobacteriaceae endosymbiont of Donacia bicoloricornis TaxID=2675772 RepID=UPI0014577F60|nr:2-oxo acid dehydrogenase subunit E2 [Enterobacteriaceae endosymbiont of Donacia bicoloricornis]